MIQVHQPFLMVIEATLPQQNNANTMRRLLGLATEAEKHAFKAKILFRDVNNQTLKAWATSYGKAKKIDMIRAAERMGWKPKCDNEADAQWLLEFQLHQMWLESQGRRR